MTITFEVIYPFLHTWRIERDSKLIASGMSNDSDTAKEESERYYNENAKK